MNLVNPAPSQTNVNWYKSTYFLHINIYVKKEKSSKIPPKNFANSYKIPTAHCSQFQVNCKRYRNSKKITFKQTPKKHNVPECTYEVLRKYFYHKDVCTVTWIENIWWLVGVMSWKRFLRMNMKIIIEIMFISFRMDIGSCTYIYDTITWIYGKLYIFSVYLILV